MGDASYYAALLRQYYYGSNASKFQLIWLALYDKKRSDPRCSGKIQPRCPDHSKLDVSRLCSHCRIPNHYSPPRILSSQHKRYLQLTQHTGISGAKLPVRRGAFLRTEIKYLFLCLYFSFGLSFYGRRFSEASLVKYACAFESATNVCPELFSRHTALTDGLFLVPSAAKPLHHPQHSAH